IRILFERRGAAEDEIRLARLAHRPAAGRVVELEQPASGAERPACMLVHGPGVGLAKTRIEAKGPKRGHELARGPNDGALGSRARCARALARLFLARMISLELGLLQFEPM